MGEPFFVARPENPLDVKDLTAHEELCRELEEHHDREEEQGREPFWPEDD